MYPDDCVHQGTLEEHGLSKANAARSGLCKVGTGLCTGVHCNIGAHCNYCFNISFTVIIRQLIVLDIQLLKGCYSIYSIAHMDMIYGFICSHNLQQKSGHFQSSYVSS